MKPFTKKIEFLIFTTIVFTVNLLVSLKLYAEEKSKRISVSKWKQVEQNTEIELYERWIYFTDGEKTMERKGIIFLPNSIDEIEKILTDASQITAWMTGVNESYELPEKYNGKNTLYLYFKVPWPFKDKDLVATFETKNINSTDTTVIYYNAVAEFIPTNSKAERLENYEAQWTITSDGPGKTKVVFQAYSKTPPVVPRFIQDPITAKIFKENLLNLRLLLIERELNSLNVTNL